MNIKPILIVIFLLLIFYEGNAQFLNTLKELKSAKISTQEKITKLDSLVLHAETVEDDSLALLFIKYAYWLYDYDLPKTINLSEKSKNLALNSSSIDSSLLYRINNDLGYYYRKDLKYISAISCYNQAVELTNSKNKLSKAYGQIGFCYDKIKDYYRASENYKIAVGLLGRSEDQVEKRKRFYYDISNVLSRQNSIESLIEARIYAGKVDSLSLAYPHLKKNAFKFKFHHAEIYSRDLSLDTLIASRLFEEAYDLARLHLDTIGMIQTLYGRGGLFNTTNQTKSKRFHQEALSLIDTQDSTNLYLNWYALGKTLAYEGKYFESSQHLIKSLHYLTGKDLSNPQNLLRQNDLFLKNADDLIYNLPLLGEVYLKWYEVTENESYLEKSLGYFQFTDRVIDYQKENSKDFLSRLFWRKKGTDLYGKALRVCYLKKEYDQALYFMEKNKALLLMEDISQKELKNSLNNHPYYVQKEMSLKRDIFSISTNLKKVVSPEQELELVKQKMDLEIDLSLLQDSIYGHKKVLQYNPTQFTVSDVQKNLGDHEIFMEYHLSVDNEHGIYTNNEKGYLLIITKKESKLLEIGQLNELYSDIKKIASYHKKPFDSNSEIEAYNKLSNRLYLKLFPNKDVRDLLADKKLILSLDYYLHFLPFEALSTSAQQTDYLIHKAEISYVYSYTFGEINSRNDLSNDQNIIAFAPQEFKDTTLIPLLHTESEVNAIRESLNVKFCKKSKATKSTFIEESSDYNIIHLATHAFSSPDSDPWISFYDEKLTLEELYLNENNASLVVLSACNTNIGKLEVGEGVMSLARGFFYGGTQSVISTLWNVDDKSTSFILSKFYGNLKRGVNKSKALHNAKLSYLDNNSLSELSPYYWSSFVLLGDTTPIEFKNSIFTNLNFIITSVSILLIIIMLIFFYKE